MTRRRPASGSCRPVEASSGARRSGTFSAAARRCPDDGRRGRSGHDRGAPPLGTEFVEAMPAMIRTHDFVRIGDMWHPVIDMRSALAGRVLIFNETRPRRRPDPSGSRERSARSRHRGGRVHH